MLKSCPITTCRNANPVKTVSHISCPACGFECAVGYWDILPRVLEKPIANKLLGGFVMAIFNEFRVDTSENTSIRKQLEAQLLNSMVSSV